MSRTKSRRPFRGKFGPWHPEDEKDQQRLLILLGEIKKFLQALEKHGIVVDASFVPYLGKVDLFREIKVSAVLTIDGPSLVLLHKVKYNRLSTDTIRGTQHVKKAEGFSRVYQSKPYNKRFKSIRYGGS